MEEVKSVDQIIADISPYYADRVKKKEGGVIDSVAESEHRLVYDSSSETLEPLYFFILDLMNDRGLKTEKFVDNFSSSPGSGHFSELGQRATVMQQQGSKIIVDINAVLRSVLNIIYDLKEFRIRLQSYDDVKDTAKKEAVILSLKQIWMDKVDIQKGNSSIKAMALGQAGFQTLLDAFLFAKDLEGVGKLDLNERVKRILLQRIHEFESWRTTSESELRKRYELERTYLKSQVNSLKLYSRWVRPYLKAASELEQKEQSRNASLVKTFNTIILELTLLGKSKVDVKKSAISGDLPAEFSNERFLRGIKRNYNTCVLVDFVFRGIPQRVSQQSHYVFGGRVDVTFRAYALNDDELKKLDEQMGKSDMEDALKLIEGATGESLEQLQKEINYFLEEDEPKKEEKKKSADNSNPFLALIGHYDKKEKTEEKKEDPKKKKEPVPDVIKDNWIEETHLRKLTVEKVKSLTYDLFNIYKKAHGMPSYD